MKGLSASVAFTVVGLASGPVIAQSAQPADKTAGPLNAEPAKIRRSETIVDDNWTVTCALEPSAFR